MFKIFLFHRKIFQFLYFHYNFAQLFDFYAKIGSILYFIQVIVEMKPSNTVNIQLNTKFDFVRHPYRAKTSTRCLRGLFSYDIYGTP